MTTDHGRLPDESCSSEESPLTRRQLLQAAVGVGGGLLLSGFAGCAEGPQRMRDAGSKNIGEAASPSLAGVAKPSANASDVAHFTQPEVRRSMHGFLNTKLRVAFANNTLNGKPLPPNRSYEGGLTGPTFRIKAGDRMKVDLFNQLPREQGECGPPNTENCPNTTNLHTHGLHISPTGNSDNVLLEIPPGKDLQFQFDIPDHHHAGTFWYHAHRHGSTASQLREGMAGALIIEGDIDQVPEIKVARDQVFLFQQLRIPFDDPQQQLPTTINGQLEPALILQPGEVQRWRLIHAGIDELLTIELVNEEDVPQDLHVIAIDGITLGKIDTSKEVFLAPGNRADILIKAGPTGMYRLKKKMEEVGLNGKQEPEQLLANIQVTGPRLNMSLPSNRELRPLAPFRPITDNELTDPPQQPELVFDIAGGQFMIDGKEFDHTRVDRTMKLNGVQEWTLSSKNGNHPFHIHVNPFQVIKINGKPVDPVWRDTILVRNNPPVTVTMRTRYEVFTGKYVLHCHNLVHEDRGMMQLIEILSS
ncbi:MAG: oxidoreductase [Nitrospirales bacterium]|nr:MAG: oxidoreductase [Nitrospirales bacterium]